MTDMEKILWRNTTSIGWLADRAERLLRNQNIFFRKQKIVNARHALLILCLTMLYVKAEIRISALEEEIRKKDI